MQIISATTALRNNFETTDVDKPFAARRIGTVMKMLAVTLKDLRLICRARIGLIALLWMLPAKRLCAKPLSTRPASRPCFGQAIFIAS
jgi:hypothetical protein